MDSPLPFFLASSTVADAVGTLLTSTEDFSGRPTVAVGGNVPMPVQTVLHSAALSVGICGGHHRGPDLRGLGGGRGRAGGSGPAR
jgi:hypothetical protein